MTLQMRLVDFMDLVILDLRKLVSGGINPRESSTQPAYDVEMKSY